LNCAPEKYDGRTATISINIPDRFWDPSRLQSVRVEVFGSNFGLIANNTDSVRTLVPEFSFVYRANYEDLWINVVTGDTMVTYTLTLWFSSTSTGQLVLPKPSAHVEVGHKTPSKRTPVAVLPKAPRPTPGVRTPLETYIGGGQVFRVQTEDIVVFEAAYCPDLFAPDYSLSITVASMSSQTATSTWVCTDVTTFPCSPASASFSDPYAKALNSVFIPTHTSRTKRIQIVIEGWGRRAAMNEFMLTVALNQD